DKVDFRNRAKIPEHVAQIVFRGVERQVPHIEFRVHDVWLYTPLFSRLFPTAGSQIITEPRSTEDPPGLGNPTMGLSPCKLTPFCINASGNFRIVPATGLIKSG